MKDSAKSVKTNILAYNTASKIVYLALNFMLGFVSLRICQFFEDLLKCTIIAYRTLTHFIIFNTEGAGVHTLFSFFFFFPFSHLNKSIICFASKMKA